MATYDGKILVLDATATAIGGQLEAAAITSGHSLGMADAAIAGIAKAHDIIVITDNTKHFLPLGMAVSSPDEFARTSN